jgi:hypothetical protein
MANSYLFDTTYSASEFDASGTGARNSYRIIIGDKQGTQSSTAATEMELLDPGMNLSWQGDDTMSKTIMGGSLSFTALLNDAQLATVETLMSGTNEGDVFCLFFNSASSSAKPYWYGHLLMESVSIQVMNEKHVVDMQFTDGLGSLRGAKWEDSPGVLYTGFKKLSFYVREIVSKLPAYAAFKDYVENELSQSAVPVTREIAWPDPLTPAGFTYDEQDHKLDNFKVRAETFNKPKKQQNRFRETEAPFDYFTAADVLDDICTTFGATACLFGGYLNLGCRLDIATLKGNFVYDASYDYTSDGDSWTITGQYDAWDNLSADDQYNVLSGASKGYTMPIAQVYVTHEEGGSDDLYADGWFINPDISYVNHDQADSSFGAVAHRPSVFSGSSINSSSTLFNGRADLPRRDKLYDFLPPLGGPTSVDLGFYLYPASPTAYLGFPAKTVNDLEYQSGEEVRLTFGGSAKFFARRALDLDDTDVLRKVHIGSHLIIRVRIQFTTEDGDGYRLSRPVETHAISDGSPDFITIDNVQSYYDTANAEIVSVDKHYFRKLYREMVWLKDDASNYDDDGWFEIMVPHGDNENNGEGYGSTLYPLTQQYGGQVGYAPIGTKIKGEDDGAGVVLEESGDDQTLLQYFREDITFSLPYANEAQTVVLDFEDFYFEMGAQEYEPQTGPREASGATATGTWEGDIPLWKSAEAGGTGSVRYPGSGNHFAQPDYLHFTGMRVTVGDGSESSDLTTKVLGGDGYEIINLGSTRLGSRTGFLNNHATGTVFAREKSGNAEGQFPSGTGRLQDDYKERLQWKGHRHGEGSIADDGTYDSIHRYYGEAYINLFGQAREKYSMTLVSSPNSPAYRTLRNPFEVMKMNTFQTDKGIDEYLMPLKYSWTLNDGVSGEFIKVGQVRDITTITSDEGRPIRGGGAIVGLGTGVDVIQPALESKFVTDAITVDDETGDVTVIAVKTGSQVFNADAISDGTTNKVFTATEQTKLTGIEQSATANQSNAFLKNRINHTGQQSANTISNFASAVNAVTEVAASREVTDTITVTSGVITAISIDADVLDVDSIEVSPNKTFVSSAEQALIIPTAQVANTANTNASNALTKTNLIQSDSGGVTGFTIADNVTVLSTDQVTEDVGRTFKTATEQSKLDKIGFNTGNTVVYNLDTEASKITASKNVTDRIGTTGAGGSTKITTLTTVNGDFDVDDGRLKNGHLTANDDGISAFQTAGGSGTSVNLYHIHQSLLPSNGTCADVGVYADTCSGLRSARKLPDPDSDRSGQTGSKILMVNASGDYLEINDGSANHFLQTDGSGRYAFAAAGASTTFTQVYSQNFFDDISTLKHYLPFKDINEQTTIYQEEAAMLMPFDGRIKSISLKTSSLTGNGSLIVGVSTLPTGSNIFSSQGWTEEETETLAVGSTDDNHTFHFVFDNAKHFDAGDSCVVSLRAATDVTGNGYWYVTTVIEYDTSNNLGSSSTEHETNP